MAERRMFAKTIIDSDEFLDMPQSTQALYFHLSMRADDDGFINSPKKIQRATGSSGDDLKLLIAKRYLIPFESGVVVIRHWKIHNCIQRDRYKPTLYQSEKALLTETDNKEYTECIHDVSNLDTQVRLGKDSVGKDNKKESVKEKKHAHGEYKNVLLSDDELDKLKAEFPDWEDRIERLSSYIASTGKSYKSHFATIRRWAQQDQPKQKAPRVYGDPEDFFKEI